MRKGFTEVDRQADPAMLVAGMEATAQWPAVQRLRRWERDRLQLGSGDHVLDVGCGPGDVLAELAALVEPDGRAVGVDASEQMLAAAAERAKSQGVAIELLTGDAAALTFEDTSFDVVRSERTLQWVSDPARAVAELVRVTKPGGRICVIDTDWRTLLPDHPSPDVARRFLDAMGTVRGDQISVGGRLVNLLRRAGVQNVEATAETHMWLDWNPDEFIAPPGMVPLRFVAKDLVDQGFLDAADADQMMDEFEQSARDGRFFVSLTMFAAAGTAPS
jgi:SAM-dependent methyltransferase